MTSSIPATKSPTSPPVWHTLSVEQALQTKSVQVSQGLSDEQAHDLLQQFGPNSFTSTKKEPGWLLFLRQYRDPMQIILLAAGLVSGLLVRQWGTAILLIALTLLNAIISLRQEGKAEASVETLQKMMIVKAKVRRAGTRREVGAEEIVPGDIVLIEAGDRVPADGRLIQAATLEVDESALTGESLPVPKHIELVPGPDTPLGDRVDMVYMNTNVTRGSAEVLVTATGNSTEVGHISNLLQSTEVEATPLTKQLEKLTNQIALIALIALVVSVLLGYLRGQPLNTLFVTAVAFAVAAIPTGLPTVVTALLAAGTTLLAKEGAIVKRLRSVETLGSTSAINSDKTGTLTLNQMTAVELTLPGRHFTISGEGYATTGQISRVAGVPSVNLEPYLLPMALASDAVVKDGALIGDPTEGALVVLAAKGGIDVNGTREQFPRVALLPFDAAYKLMATFHAITNEQGKSVIRCYVKGAPDQLLARSSQALDGDRQLLPLETVRANFTAENERLGKQGLRVMAVARRDLDPASFNPSADLLSYVSDLTLLALAGIVDPPRPEARVAIAKAKSAGIQVRMITGDHVVTAAAIAQQLGIEGRAISGTDFAAMSDEEALQQVGRIGVIARVTPEDKVRLVKLLKRAGHVTAMTGDGVNDAPALKTADIGVAMGITGTDVSKEAAVMILTDDNFATIVRAVEMGRVIYDNLLRYLRFQMSTLFSFILTFLGAAFFNILGGIPFLPLQVLWINFTVDILMSLGLGTRGSTPGVMDRAPRPADAPMLPRRVMFRLFLLGFILTLSTLGVCVLATQVLHLPEIAVRTMGLTTFMLSHLLIALELNDDLKSIFSMDLLDNPRLLKMGGISVLLAILMNELGFMNKVFSTTSLDGSQWLICIACASLIVWVIEVEKIFRRHAVQQPAVRPVTTVTEEQRTPEIAV